MSRLSVLYGANLYILRPLNDNSRTAKARIIKFRIQVDCIIYWLLNNKPPLKGALLGSHDPFSILMLEIISAVEQIEMILIQRFHRLILNCVGRELSISKNKRTSL